MAINIDTYYRQHGPMVLRRCRKLLRNEEKAVDAMQDVFVQLLRNKDRLDESAPANLLMRMATNTCLNMLSAEKRHPHDSEDALLLQIAGANENTEARLNASMILSKLFGQEKESTRTIAVLHLVDGMTLEEVAAEVGMSVSGIRKRLRGLQLRVAEFKEV